MSEPLPEDSPGAAVEPLLTVHEVAAAYRVEVSAVRRWRLERLPPHGFKVGKHLRYHPQTVRDDMDRRAAQAAAAATNPGREVGE